MELYKKVKNIPLLYLSSVKVCHVAGRRDAGSESLWLMYDPPRCAVLVVQFFP